MSTPRSNPKTSARPPKRRPAPPSRNSALAVTFATCTLATCTLAACALAPLVAHALSTDKQQNMLINSDYAKIIQNKDNNQPPVTFLNGNVTMDQGTTKARGDEATVYQHPSDAKDAQGNDISGNVQRVIMIGKKKQAHMEQQQDAGGLMTGDADKIDYNADTSIAVFTGNVVVVQPGRGKFNGAYMVYNTNTGEMESGDKSGPAQRVQMVIEPKNKTPATPAKPADGTTPAAAPADAAKPAAAESKKKKKHATTTTPATAPPAATTPATTPTDTKPTGSPN